MKTKCSKPCLWMEWWSNIIIRGKGVRSSNINIYSKNSYIKKIQWVFKCSLNIDSYLNPFWHAEHLNWQFFLCSLRAASSISSNWKPFLIIKKLYNCSLQNYYYLTASTKSWSIVDGHMFFEHCPFIGGNWQAVWTKIS